MTCKKPLIDHKNPPARLLSESDVDHWQEPTLAFLYREARFAASFITVEDQRNDAISAAVTATLEQHSKTPLTEAELRTAVRRHVYRETYHLRRRSEPLPDSEVWESSPDDEHVANDPLDGDIRVSPSRPQWQAANEMQNRTVARIDAVRALQQVLKPEEIRFYVNHVGSKVKGVKTPPAARARLARIRTKLRAAKIL